MDIVRLANIKGRRFLLPFFIFIVFSLNGYTLVFYIDGDNSLYEESKSDVHEILTNFSPENEGDICIILWDRFNEKPLVIVKDIYNTDTTELSFSINSGDSDTYRLLGSIVNEHKKSSPFYLILWDHGSAWIKKEIKGFGYDSEFDDYLDVWNGELKKAIEEFTGIAGRCDAIIFDACIMQTVEVDYEIKDYTDYIVASQDLVPLDGLPYEEYLKEANFNSVLSSLKFLVDTYVEKYSNYDVSLSVVSTYKMNYWWFYFNDRVDKYIETEDVYYSQRTPFSYNLFLTNNDNIDIYDIYPVSVYSRGTVQREGISAWFPQTKDAYDDYINIYHKLEWAKSSLWDEYIGRVIYNWEDFNVLTPTTLITSPKISWNEGYSIYGIKGYNVIALKNVEFTDANVIYNSGFNDYNDILFAKTGTLIVDNKYNLVSICGRLNLWVYSINGEDTVLVERINKSLKDTLKRVYKGKTMIVNIDDSNNYVYLNLFSVEVEIYSDFFTNDTSVVFSSPYDTMIIMVNAVDNRGSVSPFIYDIYSNTSLDVSVYPQPAKDRIFFDIGNSSTNVKIYTISGELVKVFYNVSGKVEWDLYNMYGNKVASGVYVLYLENNGYREVFVIK